MKKVGIIRCRETEDICGGGKDFRFAAKGDGGFEAFGACEIVGFVSCGGCPGKRAVQRAKMLREQGAEVIVLASCITKGTPLGFPCPNRHMMQKAIQQTLGEALPIVDYTHPAPQH